MQRRKKSLIGIIIICIVIASIIYLVGVCRADERREYFKLNQLSQEYRPLAKNFVKWISITYPEYLFVIAEVYRTQKRQGELFKMGSHITQVRISKHTQRKAFDLYFIKDEKILSYEEAPYEEIGRECIKRGNVWGGNWKTLKDYGHFEFR